MIQTKIYFFLFQSLHTFLCLRKKLDDEGNCDQNSMPDVIFCSNHPGEIHEETQDFPEFSQCPANFIEIDGQTKFDLQYFMQSSDVGLYEIAMKICSYLDCDLKNLRSVEKNCYQFLSQEKIHCTNLLSKGGIISESFILAPISPKKVLNYSPKHLLFKVVSAQESI